MPSVLSVLYSVNRKLSGRFKERWWFYAVYISCACLAIGSLEAVVLFGKPERNELFRNDFSLIIFIITAFDLAMIIKRFTSKTLIEPVHLAVFPLNKWQKIRFQAALLLADFKTLVYITGFLLFILYFLLNKQYTAVPVVFVIWILLLSAMLSWLLTFYHLAGRLLSQHTPRSEMILFGFLCFIFFGMILFGRQFIPRLPIVGNTGNALYGLVIHDPFMITINILMLAGFIAAAWLVIGITKPSC